MTAAACLPDNAPFAPEAISQLNRVIAQSSPAQRHWLAGFLAGIEATNTAAAPAQTPRQKLTILFATESGNAEALAQSAKRDATRQGFAARLLDAADATPADLATAGTLLVIASTWGEGEAPQRATRFMRALLADDAPRLPGLRFAVLALGDRAYAQFCETGRTIDARLERLGAIRAAPRLDADLDYEAPAATWLAATLKDLRTEPASPPTASSTSTSAPRPHRRRPRPSRPGSPPSPPSTPAAPPSRPSTSSCRSKHRASPTNPATPSASSPTTTPPSSTRSSPPRTSPPTTPPAKPSPPATTSRPSPPTSSASSPTPPATPA